MRVLIKKDDKYLKVAWIKRHSDGSIIGWHLNPQHYLKNFPKDTSSFDIHYNYPRKGKFHFSYKYKVSNLTYHIRAYPDELNIKLLGNIQDIRTCKIILPDLKKFDEFIFVNEAKNLDFENPNLFRQLISSGFNLWTDRILDEVNKFGKPRNPETNDIVLDIDLLGKVGITYYPIIHNNPSNISLDIFNSKEYIRVTDNSQNPIIELIVAVIPTKQ